MAEEAGQTNQNASKKARQFDFEALFQTTLHEQQLRNAENQKTTGSFETNDPGEESGVEKRFANIRLPSGNGGADEVSFLDRYFSYSWTFRLVNELLIKKNQN